MPLTIFSRFSLTDIYPSLFSVFSGVCLVTAVLLDLDNHVVTDTGDVIVQYSLLLDRVRRGQTIEGFKTFPHPDVEKRNQRQPADPIIIREPDGKSSELSPDLFKWELDPKYRHFDIEEYLGERLLAWNPDPPEVYIDRIDTELAMMRERGMEDFIRVLIYMIEVFDQNNVVHGVGRGSACASLVLYLIGVHMVDPIEYQIPITEFLR
jgi:hypothetical protein